MRNLTIPPMMNMIKKILIISIITLVSCTNNNTDQVYMMMVNKSNYHIKVKITSESDETFELKADEKNIGDYSIDYYFPGDNKKVHIEVYYAIRTPQQGGRWRFLKEFDKVLYPNTTNGMFFKNGPRGPNIY